MENKAMNTTPIIQVNEFPMIVRGFINTTTLYIAFMFGNVRRLDMNGKFIYLWQNAKGDVHYSFSLFKKEYYTTSAIKLGNVLTQHFGGNFEVVNNTKEQLKKMINATTGLNKALTDLNRHSSFANDYQQSQLPYPLNSTDSSSLTKNQLLETLDSNSEDTTLQLKQEQPQLNQQHNLYNQEQLHKGVIQLSTYYLDSHLDTTYIKLDELPITLKEQFVPNKKQAFFSNDNGLNHKNKFIPTPWMVYQYNWCEPNQSFIILFILFMAKNDIYQALKILAWIANSSTSLNKLPFVLVMHSKEDVYMKLFFEEIVEILFNDFQCEKIEDDSLDAKSLSTSLDEKAIYNFHNITSPKILNEDAYELTNRLIHKDSIKINRKSITTVANILLTSTSKYIPMISDDVPSTIVNVDSSINELCNYLDIRPNKNTIAQFIKNDLPNFVSILRCLDIYALVKAYPIINHNIATDILGGDVDATEVFNSIIRDKDSIPFKSMVTNAKSKKLVKELDDDFNQGRVDKAHLLDYFTLLFGTGIYKSNTALIAALRKDYSNSGEPFDNIKTHVRKGRGYYFL